MLSGSENQQQRSTFGSIRMLRRRGRLAALILVLVPLASTPTGTTPGAAYPATPQVLFKELFVAVQSAAIYSDGKVFADAVPNPAPDVILAQYHAAQPDSPQALKRFTDTQFSLPSEASAAPSAPRQLAIGSHI